jgi:hypothetical protein
VTALPEGTASLPPAAAMPEQKKTTSNKNP